MAYEHVGSVRHDIYRKKKTDWEGIGAAVVIVIILIAIFG